MITGQAAALDQRAEPSPSFFVGDVQPVAFAESEIRLSAGLGWPSATRFRSDRPSRVERRHGVGLSGESLACRPRAHRTAGVAAAAANDAETLMHWVTGHAARSTGGAT